MSNWFKNWFEKPLNPIGFDCLKTDMHSHLIPNIDDGASSLEDSIKMISALRKLGFQKIITTPHVMSDFYKNTPETINAGLALVRAELQKNKIDVQLEAAAEYYLDYEFELKIKEQNLLTFSGKYILVETSFIEAPPKFKELIFKLQIEGYKVILAHPERYPFMSMQDYEELADRSVFLQLNLLSLLGNYGLEVKDKAQQLIDNNLISFVGTDCHHIGHANLYEKCQTTKAWHQLVESGKLLIIFYKLALSVEKVRSTFLNKPCNTFPGPTSVTVVAPSNIICCMDCVHLTEAVSCFIRFPFISSGLLTAFAVTF